MVRCGVVWCGVVWCGVVWFGVVWCGERCSECSIRGDMIESLLIVWHFLNLSALPVPLLRQVFLEVIWTAQAWSKSLFREFREKWVPGSR